ncbi:MAG TPA: hypothetical protein VLL72_12105 [Kiloniellales bacterium]|nr:hypothetical protein [Kiloniellales bacterium]
METSRAPAGDDFAPHAWHDNLVYEIRLVRGDPERNDWRSELVLGLDHILEWLADGQGGMRFRIAPARLVFSDVTDLVVALDWGDSGCRVALNEVSIDRIERDRLPESEQKICLDRPYYRWRIETNLPTGGRFSFGASGYRQDLLGPAILCDQPWLPPDRRPAV